MIVHFTKNTAALVCVVLTGAFGSLAAAESFIHPGGLHTQADLDRMKIKVAAKAHPWIDAWDLFITDPKAQENWRARPAADMGSRQRAQDDATAMYYNALRWYISGEEKYAECAVRIASDWTATVREEPYGDHLSGIPIGSFALAAEVLRTYPGWSKVDFDKFKKMMVKYWYPKCSDFLKNHRAGPVSRSWANWDACNMLAVLGIGVLSDDRTKYNEAVEYFKNGPGMGSIKNAAPFVYPGGLAQWQEAGRDWAHTMGGQGLLAEFCQTTWNQGLDLFGYNDNKLLKGGEYAAQFTLWKGVPYTYYTNADNANQSYISTNYRGRLDASHFELLYNHYVVRKGHKAPNIKAFAELKRPEPGEIDVFGHGTLTFTLDAEASPYPAFSAAPVPLDLTATPGIGRVDLKWSPSGAYTAHGYEVFRATSDEGPFTSIHSTKRWTTPRYADTDVINGMKYFYAVAALNQSGSSAKSANVSTTPVAGGALPRGWTCTLIGKSKAGGEANYADEANRSIVMDVEGRRIGGESDDCSFVFYDFSGDCVLIARLFERRGDVTRVGLMMRESQAADAKTLALTLGDVGARQVRFGTRASTGGRSTSQSGNDYTWLPIWFRIQRVGDMISAYQSPDGISWFLIGESSVSLPGKIFVGLAACGGKKANGESRVAFDNVTLASESPKPPAAPTELSVTSAGEGEVRLTWENHATRQTGYKVEAAWENGIFYEIADLDESATSFVNTGLDSPAAVRYRVRAYNTGGYAAYSNEASLAE